MQNMSREINCNRLITIIFKGPAPALATIETLFHQNEENATYKVHLSYTGDHCLIIKTRLPDRLIDPFLSGLSLRLKRLELQRPEEELDILIIDQEKTECALDQDEIDLCKGWQVKLLPSGEKPRRPNPRGRIFLKKEADAFGSGLHPSTRLICEAILHIYNSGILKGARALDVGTGSGILSILLANLGAQRILGIDIDPKIIQTAQENACLNQVESKVSFTTQPLSKLQWTNVDVIVANLTPMVLLELLDAMVAKLNKKGCLVLSGHNLRLKNEICRRLKGHYLHMIKHLSSQDWSAEIFFRS